MVGAGRLGSISSLTLEKVLFKKLIAPRTTTPLRIATFSASSSPTTTTKDTRAGATRLSSRTRKPTSRPKSWPISTTAKSTTTDSTAASR